MKKKLLFLLGGAFLGGLFSLNVSAQISWTDKTTLITNPSFETDDAIQDLKNCGWSADRATGWTISPSSSSNAQVGVGNSTSTIQGIGETFSPSAGDKYFYTRNNWNANTDYSFSQVITREGDNLKAGLYKLTCKAATFSSNAAFNTLTLGLQEGTGTSVTHDGIVLNVWNTWGVIIYKRADDTNLTIEVKFKPGYADSNKHYVVLLDDFHLEYISEDDAFTASSANTIDFSDIINNAGIYNHSTKGTMPRGWTATKHTVGNGNYTEGEKGDTRLEGWSGSNLDIDYNQTITNLPAGTYTVTAAALERAKVGKTYIYASTDGQEDATGQVNSDTESDITTSELKVTNGTMKIGIRSTANDWVTGDNFRISFRGFDVDAVKTDYETAYSIAENARDAQENDNIVGEERTTFENVITTYTTTTSQSYSWYVGAKEALENATTAFESVRGTYDALVAEIAKAKALGIAAVTADGYAATSTTTAATALTNTQDLKVAEYNFVTTNYSYGVALGEWNSTGTNTSAATFNNEHWSGTTHDYKNQKDDWGNPKQGYAADSWSIDFNQNVSLPAGNYVFKVAGRQASGDKVTTSLVVTKVSDSSELGRVSDFPRSNSSRGINKSGATSFDGDDSEYANDGKGYGWEWRYVKFSLAEEATVNIAISSVATAANQWVSFGDYTLQTDNEANISLIAYNIALNDAITARDNNDYTNVIGDERTALENAIATDASLDKTNKDAIDAATTALTDATTAFTAAKDSYDAFVAAKAVTYSDDLPYASSTKFAAIASAQEAADATSAADADAKTSAILSAYRKYVESNAIAEGVTGATVIAVPDANMEVVYDGEAHTFGAWTVIGQTNGNIQLLDGESFTDGDGKNDYKYVDIYKKDNNAGIQQAINLEPGKYLLTVTARAATTNGAAFRVFAGSKTADIARIGNTGGTFDRGWNDASVEFTVTEKADVNIGVQSGNGKDLWWSATRFRLVKIGELASATMSITAAKYATFIAPFNVTIPADVTAVKIRGVDGDNKLVEETVTTTIPANTPVVLHSENVVDATFYGESVAATNNLTEGILTGTYTEIDAPEKSYILNKIDDWVGFAKVAEGNTTLKVGANRCYIKADAVTSAPFFRLGGTTNIANVENAEADAAVYDLMGRRVDAPAKGIYIVNGKKVLVK